MERLWLHWGLTTSQPLWVICVICQRKGEKEIEVIVEEIVEEMKERDREERGKWKKVKEQKK